VVPASQPAMMRQCTEPPVASFQRQLEGWKSSQPAGAEFNRRRAWIVAAQSIDAMAADVNLRSTMQNSERIEKFIDILVMADVLRDLFAKNSLPTRDDVLAKRDVLLHQRSRSPMTRPIVERHDGTPHALFTERTCAFALGVRLD